MAAIALNCKLFNLDTKHLSTKRYEVFMAEGILRIKTKDSNYLLQTVSSFDEIA